MGHTDVVPVNPDGWTPRPVRRRGRRRRSCGAAARSTCSTSPRRGGRVPPPRRQRASRPRARSSTSRSPTRRPSGRGARDWLRRARARRGLRRLRAHRVGRVPDADARTGRGCPVIVGEKGTFWSKITVRGTPGHGVAAVPHRQRARHRGRGRAADRRVPARRRSIHEHVAAASSKGMATSPPEIATRSSTPTASTSSVRRAAARHRPASRTRARTRRSRRRSCTAARRRTSSPTASSSRSTSARCPVRPATTCRGMLARRSAISPTRSRSSRTTTRRPRRRIDTPLWDSLAPRHRAARARARRSCPFLMVGGDRQPLLPAGRRRSATASGCSARGSRSRTTPRCSTATTSASTRSRSRLSEQLWEAVARDLVG